MWCYAYDAMGMILSEVDSADTSFNNTYVYDAFGRLVQEKNKGLDKTFVFKYNEIGNITNVKEYKYYLYFYIAFSALFIMYFISLLERRYK